MKSRSTLYSFFAVTSLRVAPLRFHAPYSALSARSDPMISFAGRALPPQEEHPACRPSGSAHFRHSSPAARLRREADRPAPAPPGRASPRCRAGGRRTWRSGRARRCAGGELRPWRSSSPVRFALRCRGPRRDLGSDGRQQHVQAELRHAVARALGDKLEFQQIRLGRAPVEHLGDVLLHTPGASQG